MYKIYFIDCVFADCRCIEDACSLALAVHRSSNVEHSIDIFDPDGNRVVRFLKDSHSSTDK